MQIFFLVFLIVTTSIGHCYAHNSTLQSAKQYSYIDRDHSLKEDVGHLSIVFGLSVSIYFATQWKTIKNTGSTQKYKDNFGRVTFDKDEPIWNFLAHPYVGSQMYLFYRARGYSKHESLKMALIQSSLFEFLIENYTERPSIQDLYKTPILGAMLGYGLEKLSLYFLNSDNSLAKILGHAMNPSTLFWFYEGKVSIIPQITNYREGRVDLTFQF